MAKKASEHSEKPVNILKSARCPFDSMPSLLDARRAQKDLTRSVALAPTTAIVMNNGNVISAKPSEYNTHQIRTRKSQIRNASSLNLYQRELVRNYPFCNGMLMASKQR